VQNADTGIPLEPRGCDLVRRFLFPGHPAHREDGHLEQAVGAESRR
jgi:hypothetical protein